MKRKVFGLAVIVLAISLSAFSTHLSKEKAAKFGTYYWFPADPVTGTPTVSSHLIYQSADPYGCRFVGDGDYCMTAWTGYTQNQNGYYAAGMEAEIDVYGPYPF